MSLPRSAGRPKNTVLGGCHPLVSSPQLVELWCSSGWRWGCRGCGPKASEPQKPPGHPVQQRDPQLRTCWTLAGGVAAVEGDSRARCSGLLGRQNIDVLRDLKLNLSEGFLIALFLTFRDFTMGAIVLSDLHFYLARS